MDNIKISAIVVGRNEARKLGKCLASLHFCDEILYADLNSDDDSVAVAQSYGCRIYRYKTYGPSCEYAQADLIHEIKNDWLIMLDPDEVLDPQLTGEILTLLPEISYNPAIAEVLVPWQFYFGKKQLKGTVWGYKKEKGILVNRKGFEILPVTHYGRRLKAGHQAYQIKRKGMNVLHHYWMENMDAFVAKHVKYLKDEGRDRYNLGQRISLPRLIFMFFSQFYVCYIRTAGYKDGLTGLFLSGFWTWYIARSNIGLYRYTKKMKYGEPV